MQFDRATLRSNMPLAIIIGATLLAGCGKSTPAPTQAASASAAPLASMPAGATSTSAAARVPAMTATTATTPNADTGAGTTVPATTGAENASAPDTPTNAGSRFAEVIAVQPVAAAAVAPGASAPKRVCLDEQVDVPETYKDKHQVGGAVLGGVIGAIAGHQLGGGKGRKLATVGGAVAGAAAGHEIQKRHQENNKTRTETRRVCHDVTADDAASQVVHYDVTYRLDGRTGHVLMDHDPGVGTGLPVRNGEVVVGEPPADSQTPKPPGSYYR